MALTVEEIEILVEANVKEALSQFGTFANEVKKVSKQIEANFNDINVRDLTANVKKIKNEITREVDDIDFEEIKAKITQIKKELSGKTEFNVSNKNALTRIRQVEKEIDNLQNKIDTDTLNLNITNDSIAKLFEIEFDPNQLNQINEVYTSLIVKQEKLNSRITTNQALLEGAKKELLELQEIYKETITGFKTFPEQATFTTFPRDFDPDIVNKIKDIVANDISDMTISINGVKESAVDVDYLNNQLKKLGNLQDKVPKHSKEWEALASMMMHIATKIAEANKELKKLEETTEKAKRTISGFETLNGTFTKLQTNAEETKRTISGFKTLDIIPRESVAPQEDTISIWDSLKSKISQLKPTLENVRMSIESAFTDPTIEQLKFKLSEAQKEFEKLKETASQNTPTEIKVSTEELTEAEAKVYRLNQQLNTMQVNKANTMANAFKTISSILDKIASIIPTIISGIAQIASKVKKWLSTITKVVGKFTGLSGIFSKIKSKLKGITSETKKGVKQLLRYVLALFSIRTAYSLISSLANAWLDTSNEKAVQLSANIEYLKYAIGSTLAPVIEYIVDLLYNLLGLVQNLVYAFTGVNIFADASAEAYAEMADSAESASEATKQLAGVHSEINNINSSSSDSTTTPTLDLSSIDSSLSPLAQKLYDFFEPLIESWEKYGGELVGMIKETAERIVSMLGSVWDSFENIISNGTVYKILENILAIIGNIATAWETAWEFDNNGDKIIQNMADALNNLLDAIKNVVSTTSFETWMINVVDKFEQITDVLASINFQPLINALSTLGGTITLIGLDILYEIVKIFKQIAESQTTANIITNIATALNNFWTAIKKVLDSEDFQDWLSRMGEKLEKISQKLAEADWQPFIDALATIAENVGTLALDILSGLVTIFLWFVEHPTVVEIILAIGTAITVVSTAIKLLAVAIIAYNVAALAAQVVSGALGISVGALSGIIVAVIAVIALIVLAIMNWGDIVDWLKEKWENFKTKITTIATTIRDTIVNAFETVKTKITTIWNNIWTKIKEVINKIIGGFETMINGFIKIINKFLDGINAITSAVGGLVGLNGTNFEISEVSLPRLATGTVAYEETVGIFAEYAGASTNPEIVTPVNIMEETFDKTLSKYLTGNDDTKINLVLNVGNKKLSEIMLEDLRTKQRQSGDGIEVLVGG